MKILVNAASVKEGGPLVVFDQLLGRMTRLRPDIDWAIAAHPSVERRWNGQRNITQIEAGTIDASAFGVPHWYEMGLPVAVRRTKADLVFSITNYLPLRRLSVPTVLLVQHAGHFSPQFDEFTRRHLRRPDRIAAWRMKTAWVERSVRMASELTVQTHALADAIAARTRRPRRQIHVIPHGPGTVAAAPCPPASPVGKPVSIGYVTKFGVQKNFEVLFAAGAHLIGQGRAIRLVLTLAPQLPEVQPVIRQAMAAGLAAAVDNKGDIDAAAVSALYDSLDLFVFPSLVESFGFPLVEAMAKGLPIVAADTPSNREIAADAGLFFPPADADALAKIIAALIDDASLREARSFAALRRARDFSWQRAAERTLVLFDAALGAAPYCGVTSGWD
jgi:glycosyltransferase involved in cell wall biosynthesis